MSLIRRTHPRGMGKGDSFQVDMPYRTFQRTVRNHQCFQNRNDNFSRFHVFPRTGIIIDCSRRIFLKPLSRLVQQFQSICQAKRGISFFFSDDRLGPGMGKFQMTLRLMKTNNGLFPSDVYTLHTQNGNCPTLMDYHFQLPGILQLLYLMGRNRNRLFFRIKVNHSFHHSIGEL